MIKTVKKYFNQFIIELILTISKKPNKLIIIQYICYKNINYIIRNFVNISIVIKDVIYSYKDCLKIYSNPIYLW